jgi:hypothetical protein
VKDQSTDEPHSWNAAAGPAILLGPSAVPASNNTTVTLGSSERRGQDTAGGAGAQVTGLIAQCAHGLR